MTTLKMQAKRDLISRQNTTQKDYSLGTISQILSSEQFSVKTLTVSRVNPFVFVGVYSKTEICGLEHLYQSSLLRISLSFTMAKVNAKLKWWNSWVGRVYCHFDFGILSTVQSWKDFVINQLRDCDSLFFRALSPAVCENGACRSLRAMLKIYI